MERGTVVALKGTAGTGLPDRVKPAGPQYLHPRQFKGLRVETLSTILTNLERGQVEDWADLTEFMIRDPHVRTVTETRATAVVGAEIVVEAGTARSEGEAELAQKAAEGFRAELESVDNLQDHLTHLLHGENVGWAGMEHGWTFTRGLWHSEPTVIPSRDIRFANDWGLQIRTYDSQKGRSFRWIEDPRPDRFIWHVPQKLGPPTMTGDFNAIVWHWLSKRWAFLFRNTGLEKFATPYRVGSVPPGAPETARERLQAAFENQSSDSWLVVEDGVVVEFIAMGGDVGPVWTDAIKDLRGEITKCLLGSELNTEVGDTGGNRALGESQSKNTMVPRTVTMAKRLASTLKCQWADPWVRFNSHLFGGMRPPTPVLEFKIINEEPRPVSELTVSVGGATVDEVRQGDGLSPWGSAAGGERVAVAQPSQGPAPGDLGPPSPGGGGSPSPFSRWQRPNGPTRRASQMSFAYRTPIEGVPFESSETPEALPTEEP